MIENNYQPEMIGISVRNIKYFISIKFFILYF